MRAKITFATLVVALALVLGASVQSTTASRVYAQEAYSFGFPGNPATPQPFMHPDWDVLVHNRDIDTSFGDPFAAQHGPDCSAPPATHLVSKFEDAVFLCKNHVMTSADSAGYAAIYLTPDRMVDFSGGTGVVRVNVSTLRTSLRDWIDFWVTPYDNNLVAPLEDTLPDLQGPPQEAVHVVMSDTNGESNFYAEVYRNHKIVEVPVIESAPTLESIMETSARLRTPYELSISRTHIKFGIPSLNVWWVDANIAPLPFTEGVVQLGHHSYTPDKDCQPSAKRSCKPNTWHWSDFSVAPATPFHMIHCDQPFVMPDAAHEVRFAAPATSGSHLRFMGQGSVKVSFDGGKSFQAARRAAQMEDHAEHMYSYWMPVPEGTRSVIFGGSEDERSGVNWFARDISIWSRSGGSSVGAAPAPSATGGPSQAPSATGGPGQAPLATGGPGQGPIAVVSPPALDVAGDQNGTPAAYRRVALGLGLIILLGGLAAAIGLLVVPRVRRRRP